MQLASALRAPKTQGVNNARMSRVWLKRQPAAFDENHETDKKSRSPDKKGSYFADSLRLPRSLRPIIIALPDAMRNERHTIGKAKHMRRKPVPLLGI